MRIDEMITADDLRGIAAEFHRQYGMYLVLDDHLTLTNPRRAAEGLRDLARLVRLDDLADRIEPQAIDAPAISATAAHDLRQLEALSRALR